MCYASVSLVGYFAYHPHPRELSLTLLIDVLYLINTMFLAPLMGCILVATVIRIYSDN